MMRFKTLFILMVIVTFHSRVWGEEAIAVIVHKNNQANSLSNRQLIDLYMGKLVAFPDGQPALPLDQPEDSALREEFYELLTGRSINQINAYWSRLRFSGLGAPPEQQDSTEVLKRVAEIDNAIGYVKLSDVTDKVKVIYTLAH